MPRSADQAEPVGLRAAGQAGPGRAAREDEGGHRAWRRLRSGLRQLGWVTGTPVCPILRSQPARVPR